MVNYKKKFYAMMLFQLYLKIFLNTIPNQKPQGVPKQIQQVLATKGNMMLLNYKLKSFKQKIA
jgi:hypothetical protein